MRGSDTGPLESRPYGSSAALSIVIVGVVMAVLVLGSLFIFRRLGSDDDQTAGVIPSPVGTSELVQGIPTATLASTAGETATTTEAANNPTATVTAPAPTPVATATSEPDESPADPSPTLPEEEPTPTEEILPDPTPTDEPAPTPTELPLEGAFGFLPRAQLPSGGVSATLELEYQLAMSLEALPTIGTVYRIVWPTYTFEDVELARDRLGLQAAVIEEGVGVFRVSSDRGTLFVSPTEIVFRAAGFSDGSGLPDDGTAIAIASEWIDLSGFITSSMDAGEVVGRDEELERLVVKFRPVAPLPNLAPNPSATVNVGPGGTVLEARIAWPGELQSSEYGYSDPLDIWIEVQNGQGFLEADITSVFATGLLTGTATITDYSTAYTLAGNPTVEQFLVPVITFLGTARIDQTGDEIPVAVSIPVVYFEEGTAG